MADWDDKKEGMKPWEYPMGEKPARARPTPPKKKPSTPTDEAEDTAGDLARRNEELVKRYGEPSSAEARKKKKKRPGVNAQDAGDALAESEK